MTVTYHLQDGRIAVVGAADRPTYTVHNPKPDGLSATQLAAYYRDLANRLDVAESAFTDAPA